MIKISISIFFFTLPNTIGQPLISCQLSLYDVIFSKIPPGSKFKAKVWKIVRIQVFVLHLANCCTNTNCCYNFNPCGIFEKMTSFPLILKKKNWNNENKWRRRFTKIKVQKTLRSILRNRTAWFVLLAPIHWIGIFQWIALSSLRITGVKEKYNLTRFIMFAILVAALQIL